jgi:hypothetical protein
MPTYKITEPNNGKVFRLTGDSPPTEQELENIFSSLGKQSQKAEMPTPSAPEVANQGAALVSPESFIWKTVRNIPGSAYRLGEGIYEAISHPVETGKAIGKTAVGGAQLLGDVVIPESLRTKQPEDYRENARAMGRLVTERYGGIENLKKTVSEDPVGFLVDASTVLTGGGTLAAKTGLQAGKTVATVGQAIEPVNIIRRGAQIIPKKVPTKMYESAAKFSTVLTPKERQLLAKTGLEHEIMPTYKGVEKAQAALAG